MNGLHLRLEFRVAVDVPRPLFSEEKGTGKATGFLWGWVTGDETFTQAEQPPTEAFNEKEAQRLARKWGAIPNCKVEFVHEDAVERTLAEI